MKKLLALILAASIALCSSSCGNDNSTNKKNLPNTEIIIDEVVTEEVVQENAITPADVPEEIANSKTYNVFKNAISSGKLYLKMNAEMDLTSTGEPSEVTIISAYNGENIYSFFGDNESSLTTLIKDNVVYMIDKEEHSIYKMTTEIEDISESIVPQDFADLGNISTGTEEVKGNIYDYEVFSNADNTIYYFDEKNLKFISIINETDLVLLEVIELSTSPDENLFQLPEYEIIDLSEALYERSEETE